MGKVPSIRDSIPARGRSIIDEMSVRAFEILRKVLPQWRMTDLQPTPPHLEPLKVEVKGAGCKKTGLPDVTLAIVKPLWIDAEGLHARFSVDAEHITQVLGKSLRLLPFITAGNSPELLAPIERPFNDRGEVVIDIPLNKLFAEMPERSLPVVMQGRYWPPKQYQVMVVPYTFVDNLPR